MFFPYSMFLGGRPRGRGGAKKKPKKAPKANWFEECNSDQLKQLCKAAKLKVSGNKADLISRLQDDDFVQQFGGNKKADRFTGAGNLYTLEALKAECRNRLLQVTGKKFDLVLRVVQHEKGTGGESLKRAATETTVVDGKQVQVAKKRKVSKPSPAQFYNRVKKRIHACTQKKYQSHWGSKCHAPDVCNLLEGLVGSLRTETNAKLVCQCYHAVVSSFVENFDAFARPGYCEGLESLGQTMARRMADEREEIDDLELETLAESMLEWKAVGDGYGLFYDCDMEELVSTFRPGGDEVEEDAKPSASSTSPTGTAATAASEEEEEEEQK